MGQVGERVLLGKQLAGFPPFSEEATLGEQHYPLPVPVVVVFVEVIFQVDQLFVSVSFTLKEGERRIYKNIFYFRNRNIVLQVKSEYSSTIEQRTQTN